VRVRRLARLPSSLPLTYAVLRVPQDRLSAARA
jgi:hypothetical protein